MARLASDVQVVDVLGVPVARLTLARLLECVAQFVQAGGVHVILYANVHTVNVAQGNSALRRAFQEADLVYCDGAGVKLGAGILGHNLPQRMTGADWIYDVCEMCAQRAYALFLYGGRPGVADKAADVLRQGHSGLRIVGTSHGYLDARDEPDVLRRISAARADILLVGLGTPRQELWLTSARAQSEVPVCWAVGALFDFVSGELPRAPRWMCDHGLEWLFRLVSEPGRLWRRYLVGNAVFTARVVAERLARTLGTKC